MNFGGTRSPAEAQRQLPAPALGTGRGLSCPGRAGARRASNKQTTEERRCPNRPSS